jgi:hypothetical protein
MSRITVVRYAHSGSDVPVAGATEPIADCFQTGEVVKQPGSMTTDPSASPAAPVVPPGRREGSPAQDALSKHQRLSLALSARESQADLGFRLRLLLQHLLVGRLRAPEHLRRGLAGPDRRSHRGW